MGAWGIQFDENDDAADWLADFEDRPTWSSVETTLQVATDTDYVEAPEASMAIAAAEIVAAARGKPSGRLPDAVAAWAAGNANGASPAEAKAALAIARVRENSELAELWAESGEADDWLASLDELSNRLN